MNKFPMTAAGHVVLEGELKHRMQVERPRLIQRIQEAIADDSNLAENSEYQAAKTEQEINENRIVELEDKLARAEVIDVSKLSGDTIKFGATVTLTEEDTGEPLMEQLKVGGRLVMPLGSAHAPQQLTVIEKIAPSETRMRSIAPVAFVPFTRSQD